MNELTIERGQQSGIEIVTISGYLDAHTAPELEQVLDELIENGTVRIVVDFSDLQYISSAGLGVFMAFIEDVRDKDGDIKLAAMSERIYNVFDLLGFPMLYEITESTEKAVQAFSEKKTPTIDD